ncbi:MAG TPA: hypothetical protein P5320_09270 [Bacteroidales bacterium]|nr:hypothetical protein [Bacteroidales bacterium]HOK74148.1 hypothetical protein [Bacteroidales bacterium]HPP91847.1 hypothetical protein [Bacteroidales bacterium]HRR16904.1 hypothetical protein [Bacteroidales bacterium]HRT48306.1 hypothetical protein [Bacteroidales bacterium]
MEQGLKVKAREQEEDWADAEKVKILTQNLCNQVVVAMPAVDKVQDGEKEEVKTRGKVRNNNLRLFKLNKN